MWSDSSAHFANRRRTARGTALDVVFMRPIPCARQSRASVLVVCLADASILAVDIAHEPTRTRTAPLARVALAVDRRCGLDHGGVCDGRLALGADHCGPPCAQSWDKWNVLPQCWQGSSFSSRDSSHSRKRHQTSPMCSNPPGVETPPGRFSCSWYVAMIAKISSQTRRCDLSLIIPSCRIGPGWRLVYQSLVESRMSMMILQPIHISAYGSPCDSNASAYVLKSFGKWSF